jgi:hypothetical protein
MDDLSADACGPSTQKAHYLQPHRMGDGFGKSCQLVVGLGICGSSEIKWRARPG